MKLHLAASRFERLLPRVTNILCTPGWIHLGQPPLDWIAEIREQFRFGCYFMVADLIASWIYRRWRPRRRPEELKRLEETSDFRQFHFDVGHTLEFEDNTFTFVLSEHFFEHLTLPQALALLKECHRIMKPGAVVRTSVPDADFRTYDVIENPGYPSPKVPWNHHQKHKMRWNVISFSEALRLTGFIPRPVQYSSPDGMYHESIPDGSDSPYENCGEPELIGTLDYHRRLPSLVIDGIKPA